MTDILSCEAGLFAKSLKDLAGLARGDDATSNVLVHYGDDIVTLTTSNMTQQMERRVPIKTKGSGSFLVNATKLAAVTGSYPSDGKLKIEIGIGNIVVKCGRSRFTFQTADADVFPLIPRGKGVRISLTDDFRNALSAVRHAVSQNDVHWDICGVALAVHDGILEAFSMDSSRAAVCAIGKFDMPSIVLPTQAIDLILRSDLADDAEMEIEENAAWIEFGATTICSKRIDTKPRDIHRIMGWEPDMTARMDRKEIISALSRLLLVASDRDRAVAIDLSRKGAVLSNDAGQEEVGASLKGDAIRIGFKAELLKSSLESLSSDEFEIHMRGPFEPTMIVGLDEPDTKLIVTPYRVAGASVSIKEIEDVE